MRGADRSTIFAGLLCTHSCRLSFIPIPLIRLHCVQAPPGPSLWLRAFVVGKAKSLAFPGLRPSLLTPQGEKGTTRAHPCHAPVAGLAIVVKSSGSGARGRALPIVFCVARRSRPARLLAPLSRLGISAASRRKARAWGVRHPVGEPTSHQPGTGASPRCPVAQPECPWKIARRIDSAAVLDGVEKRGRFSTLGYRQMPDSSGFCVLRPKRQLDDSGIDSRTLCRVVSLRSRGRRMTIFMTVTANRRRCGVFGDVACSTVISRPSRADRREPESVGRSTAVNG